MSEDSIGLSVDPFDAHWSNRLSSYPSYPTVRHRQRLILEKVHQIFQSGILKVDSCQIFDFGCGEGQILSELLKQFPEVSGQLLGSDPSSTALAVARARLPGNVPLFEETYPSLSRPCDLIICSEVIEHSQDPLTILNWFSQNIRPSGQLILTTQAGPRFGIDYYSGHTQHFTLNQLRSELNQHGFRVITARLWGFPFFSLQKRLADLNFPYVRQHFLENRPSRPIQLFFNSIYAAYYLHDPIRLGPQIIIRAERI